MGGTEKSPSPYYKTVKNQEGASIVQDSRLSANITTLLYFQVCKSFEKAVLSSQNFLKKIFKPSGQLVFKTYEAKISNNRCLGFKKNE